MSFQTIFMICMAAAVTLTWVIRPFFSLSLSLLRGPKEMKDPRWVEGFHSGTYSNKIFVYFLCWPKKKQRSQSYQLPSIMLSVVLCNIGQYTLKHEHLTTLSRALPHSKKKKWSRLLQTVISWSANHLLYHIVLPVVTWTLRTSNAPAPPYWHLKTIHTDVETIPRFCHQLEFFILTGPIAFFIVLLHSDFSPGC